MAAKYFCDGCKSEIKGRMYRLDIRIGNGYDFGADLCEGCRNEVAKITR